MDRRRFLKYAGATAAVVGASALGLDHYMGQRPTTVTPTTSATLASDLSATSSSTLAPTVRLASLRGRLFFDYNGNGIQDVGEPAVPKVRVLLKKANGVVAAEAISDSSGDYKLVDIRVGLYTLSVEAEDKFQYMCRSSEEFRTTTENYELSLGNGENMPDVNIGLMEGFLTLPISSGTRFSVGRYYDWDPDPKKSLWWNGMVGNDPYNHGGIDYDASEGEDVVAPAPGTLYPIERGPQGQLSLGLYHSDIGLATLYNHLSKVAEKTAMKGFVVRGEKIAETGSTGASYPHLHFSTGMRIENRDAFLDPYRPLLELNAESSGYWARQQDEKDYWQTIPLDINPNLKNFWTKDNDPQFAS